MSSMGFVKVLLIIIDHISIELVERIEFVKVELIVIVALVERCLNVMNLSPLSL